MEAIMDIFEKYGFVAKQYDGLHTIAAQRTLTPAEQNFYSAFADMLNGDKEEKDMMIAWNEYLTSH